ncbi:MAG: BMC domain-containing protein [Eubacteriales bacterium]|nr:BMC domain-containing protein [Eubacteriales bacterium]
MQSFGFVETEGYVPAFAVADAMMKAADVKIIKKVWIGAAMVTIVIGGEIGAVRTAVDSGAAVANQMKALLSCYTIARPTEELIKIITE